jgi:glutamyl/glutaminyl-tRNA synthetase
MLNYNCTAVLNHKKWMVSLFFCSFNHVGVGPFSSIPIYMRLISSVTVLAFMERVLFLFMSQGASKNLNLMEWDKLWTINKKIIDPVCARHTAVLEQDRVLLTVTNGPDKPFVRIIPRHKKYEPAGKKATTFTNKIWLDYTDAASISQGEEITLMDWGNAIVREIKKDSNNKIVGLIGELHLEGSVKSTKLKLTWLPDTDELVHISLVEFDYLIKKKKVSSLLTVQAIYLPYVIFCSISKQQSAFLIFVNLLILEAGCPNY